MDHFKDGFHSIRHVSDDPVAAVKHETEDSGVDMALPPPIDFSRKNFDADDVELPDVKDEEDADELVDPADEWGDGEEDLKWSPKKEVQLYPEMTIGVDDGGDDPMRHDGEYLFPTEEQAPCQREYTCRPCQFITGAHSEYRDPIQ